RGAMIAREEADVQAEVAQATAELQMQEARIEQTRLRLQADLIQPAEARRREAEEAAKGEAAKIVEQGQATARVLADIGATYAEDGALGRDVLLLQKVVPVLARLSGTMGSLKVDRLTLLGHGAAGSSLAGSLVGMSEQIKAATGID